MMRPLVRLSAFAAAGLVLIACGEGEAPAAGAAEEAAAPDAVEAEEMSDGEAAMDDSANVAIAASDLGDHLVDGDGMTLYLFTDDPSGESVCTEGCLDNWPALTVDTDPVAGDGVDSALLGTIVRDDDGSTQVTYDGQPLYLFAGDDAPGDVTGQEVGDVWFVVSPDGSAIGAESAADEMDQDNGGGLEY